ncbi:Hypothetical predicted protein, partial [Paramuricea clavata]
NVLNGQKRPKNKKEYKEAKRLLNEVQTKYNEVRCESLRSTTMAADILQKPGVSAPATPAANTRDVLLSRGRTRGTNGIASHNGAKKELSKEV